MDEVSKFNFEFLLALMFHLLLFGLFALSFNLAPQVGKKETGDAIQAVMFDEAEIDFQIQALKQQDIPSVLPQVQNTKASKENILMPEPQLPNEENAKIVDEKKQELTENHAKEKDRIEEREAEEKQAKEQAEQQKDLEIEKQRALEIDLQKAQQKKELEEEKFKEIQKEQQLALTRKLEKMRKEKERKEAVRLAEAKKQQEEIRKEKERKEALRLAEIKKKQEEIRKEKERKEAVRLAEIKKKQEEIRKEKERKEAVRLAEIKKKQEAQKEKERKEAARLAEIKKKQEREAEKARLHAQIMADMEKRERERQQNVAAATRLTPPQLTSPNTSPSQLTPPQLTPAPVTPSIGSKNAPPSLSSQAVIDAALKKQQEEREINQVMVKIENKIVHSWSKPMQIAGRSRLFCVLRVQLMSNGNVVSVSVVKSSGDKLFDNSASSAVYKASPLPTPSDKSLFEEKFKSFTFTFRPE